MQFKQLILHVVLMEFVNWGNWQNTLDNEFASKFILKFPTPTVQEKEDFPQRQQWTVSDSTFLGKEKKKQNL